MLGGLTPSRVLGANDRIRIGTLGTGERCKVLMRAFKEEPSVRIGRLCGRLWRAADQGLKLCAPEAKDYVDYRDVLDRKDIDAVIIGSPDHWHIPMLHGCHAGRQGCLCGKAHHALRG